MFLIHLTIMFWPYNVYIRVQGPKDAMRNKLKYLTQL